MGITKKSIYNQIEIIKTSKGIQILQKKYWSYKIHFTKFN